MYRWLFALTRWISRHNRAWRSIIEILEKQLGVPVIPTIGAKGQGVKELIEKALEVAAKGNKAKPIPFQEGLEKYITELSRQLVNSGSTFEYPVRWTAIKLLEGDTELQNMISSKQKPIIKNAAVMADRIEKEFKEPAYVAIASERYAIAGSTAAQAQRQTKIKPSVSDYLEKITTHKIGGYIVAFIVVAGLLLWTFGVGTSLSNLLTRAFSFFQRVDPSISGNFLSVLWNGLFGGLVAGITLVIPYVVPFYLMLSVLEDSGILTRVAFMLDSAMHRMGLHGKAIIPIILGYGCNVPAIYSTRIMGTRRERLLAAFAITFSPCAARTVIILGLVGAFLGIPWAIALYAVDIIHHVCRSEITGEGDTGRTYRFDHGDALF